MNRGNAGVRRGSRSRVRSRKAAEIEPRAASPATGRVRDELRPFETATAAAGPAKKSRNYCDGPLAKEHHAPVHDDLQAEVEVPPPSPERAAPQTTRPGDPGSLSDSGSPACGSGSNLIDDSAGSTATRSGGAPNASTKPEPRAAASQSIADSSPEPRRNSRLGGSQGMPLPVAVGRLKPRRISSRFPILNTPGSANKDTANGRLQLPSSEATDAGPSARSEQTALKSVTITAEELNELKKSVLELRGDKRNLNRYVGCLEKELQEKKERLVSLEAAQEASFKMLQEQRASQSATCPRGLSKPHGPEKAVRKRKNHKDSMRDLRQVELGKMVRGTLDNAELIAGQVIVQFDEKWIRTTSCRTARGLAVPSDGQRRTATRWLPDAESVTGGRGTITQHLVPENPLSGARRPLYGGGLIAVPGMLSKHGTPHHFVTATRHLVTEWLTRDSDANLNRLRSSSGRSFTEKDINDAAEKVSQTALRGAVREGIHRAVGEVKKCLTDKFFKLVFPNVDGKSVLSSLSAPAKLAACLSLGAGSIKKNGLSLTLEEWCSAVNGSPNRKENPFSHWRALTRDELEENFAYHLPESENVSLLEIAYDNWASQADAREGKSGSPNSSVDKLFLNSHAVAAMQAFVGFPMMRTGSIGDGTLSGPSSIVSIARADAWMATVLAIGRQESEETERNDEVPRKSVNQGRRNHQFRHVFDDIYPLAVEALLMEIRRALEDWATDSDAMSYDRLTEHGKTLGLNDRSVELHAPFSLEVADEMRSYLQKYDEIESAPESSRDRVLEIGSGNGVNSLIGKGEDSVIAPSGQIFPFEEESVGGRLQGNMSTEQLEQVNALQEELSEAMKSAVATSVILDAYHNGDPFLVEWREATTAFAIKDKKSSTSCNEYFLALKPEFFKSNVCFWFGEVQDAYVGRWKPCSGGSQNHSRASDNGTFYHPLCLDGMSTHLDSNEVDMVAGVEVSDDDSESGAEDGLMV